MSCMYIRKINGYFNILFYDGFKKILIYTCKDFKC